MLSNLLFSLPQIVLRGQSCPAGGQPRAYYTFQWYGWTAIINITLGELSQSKPAEVASE